MYPRQRPPAIILDGGAGVLPVGIGAFRSGSAFFLDNVPAPQRPLPPPNAWYRSNVKTINFRRQRMEVLIPVRSFGQSGSAERQEFPAR